MASELNKLMWNAMEKIHNAGDTFDQLVEHVGQLKKGPPKDPKAFNKELTNLIVKVRNELAELKKANDELRAEQQKQKDTEEGKLARGLVDITLEGHNRMKKALAEIEKANP